jgi:hypothetical protein
MSVMNYVIFKRKDYLPTLIRLNGSLRSAQPRRQTTAVFALIIDVAALADMRPSACVYE